MDLSFLKKIDWTFFNWLDILFFVVLIYFARKYTKRGLVRSLFKMALGALSIFLSALLSPVVNGFIKNKTPFYDILKGLIKNIIDSSQNINAQSISGVVKDNIISNPEASLGISRDLLNEILIGGNFGHYDNRYQLAAKDKKFKRGVTMLKRNMHSVMLYPSEVLWSPIWKLWHWCWRKQKGYL